MAAAMGAYTSHVSAPSVMLCLRLRHVAGGTPRFVAENKQALRSLMQLHPLNLTKADAATISQPPSPNPLLDTNPFGAVPLSALVQTTPAAALKKKQTAGAVADGGHLAAALQESAVYTPQGRARGEDEDVQRAPQAFIFQRQAAIPADSFQDLIKQQVGSDFIFDPVDAHAHAHAHARVHIHVHTTVCYL